MYKFTCECGKPVETVAKEGVCPHCNREFTLVWPATMPPTSGQPKTISAELEQK